MPPPAGALGPPGPAGFLPATAGAAFGFLGSESSGDCELLPFGLDEESAALLPLLDFLLPVGSCND